MHVCVCVDMCLYVCVCARASEDNFRKLVLSSHHAGFGDQALVISLVYRYLFQLNCLASSVPYFLRLGLLQSLELTDWQQQNIFSPKQLPP